MAPAEALLLMAMKPGWGLCRAAAVAMVWRLGAVRVGVPPAGVGAMQREAVRAGVAAGGEDSGACSGVGRG